MGVTAMIPVDREGTFRGTISSYGLTEAESGAVGVNLKVTLTEWWNGEEWLPWTDYNMEADGAIWIVKKDGQINKLAAESLMKFAGWDGNIEAIAMETWAPCPCAVAVTQEEYKGIKRFRVSFINDHNRTPGAMSNVSGDKVKALQNRFGSQFRALTGNLNRNGAPVPPPTTKPLAPPPPQFAQDGNGKDIPF